MKKIITFLKQFNYWKALPGLSTLVLAGIFVSLVHGEYFIWWLILGSLPFLYLMACIKTPFERNIEYLNKAIDWAYDELDPIKQAMKMSTVSMKNAHKCRAKAMYGLEDEKHHWEHLTKQYEMMRKNWREELEFLINKNQKQ